MARMLRLSSHGWHGCCSACANPKNLAMRPGPRERHQARAKETRQWRREAQDA